MGNCQKVGHHFSNKLILKIDFIKKCAPKLVFFNEKKMRKIQVIFDMEN